MIMYICKHNYVYIEDNNVYMYTELCMHVYPIMYTHKIITYTCILNYVSM